MDGTLNLLEHRIEALEATILPPVSSSISSKGQSQTVTDLLLQSKSMIGSALSCRTAITSILQHMREINEYLDPWHGDNQLLELCAKRQYLLELSGDLKEVIQLFGTFKRLVALLESAHITRVTDLADNKLETLAISSYNTYENSTKLTTAVLSTLQQYTDITNSIKLIFMRLDKAVHDLEAGAKTVA